MKKKRRIILIILVMIMVGCMSLSIASCIMTIREISNEHSVNNSKLIASLVEDSIENTMTEPISVALTMSEDVTLKDLFTPGNYEDTEVVGRVVRYLDSIKQGMSYQMVFAASDDPKMYYTSYGFYKHLDIEGNAKDAWYQEFMNSGKKYVLNVDTDEVNNYELSVFVNTLITDKNDEALGVCGVGLTMTDVLNMISKYEKEYDIKISLIDSSGLIKIDSDTSKIDNEVIDTTAFGEMSDGEYYIEDHDDYHLIATYIEALDWYLIIENINPEVIDVDKVITPSIYIFFVGLIAMVVAIQFINTYERRMNTDLIEKTRTSMRDELTGLYNRHAYEDKLNELRSSEDISGIVIVAIDINGLKAANDTIGHHAGDELVIASGDTIKKAFIKYGKVYRTGGDEFMAILNCTEEEVKKSIEDLSFYSSSWEGENIKELALAVGYVVCADHPDLSLDDMKELADKLMYEDKDEYYRRTGKDRRKAR